jgi:hypothetical protein
VISISHFAELDENNIVLRVLVGDNNLPNEGYDWFVENLGGRWIQTSYNAKIRKNYAGIGFRYDEELDAFIPPQPFSSWTFNEETANWMSPVAYPQDGRRYNWDEETLTWKEVEINV